MANKKITDATTATSVAGTDKVFLNQGGDLKQVDLNSAVANSQAVQTLNSNLSTNILVNREGAILIKNGNIYILALIGFPYYSSDVIDLIAKYAPNNYQVRNVVVDAQATKKTYVLSLSSTNRMLIDINSWKVVVENSEIRLHGTLIWIKS